MIIGDTLANGLARRYFREMCANYNRVFSTLQTSGVTVQRKAGKQSRKMLKRVQRIRSPWIVLPPAIVGSKRWQIVLVVMLRPIDEDLGELVCLYADHAGHRLEPSSLQFTRHSLARLMQTYRSTDRNDIVMTLLAIEGAVADNVAVDTDFGEVFFYDQEQGGEIVAFILNRESHMTRHDQPILRLKTVIRDPGSSGKHRHVLNVLRNRDASRFLRLTDPANKDGTSYIATIFP